MLISVALGAAAFGFVFSLLFAIIGSVSFPDVIVRPILVGLLFGGVGAGIVYLLESQFPEIFTGASGRKKEEDLREEGSKVDIVLPKEEPGSYGPTVEEFSHGEDGVEEISPHPSPEPESGETMDFSSPKETQSPSDGEPAQVDSRSGPLPSSEQLDQEQEDLPDLGAFAASFQQGDDEEIQEDQSSAEPGPSQSPEGESDSTTVTFEGEEHDPEIMARAVQHALKSDRGGS
jgi:hypothetical protein